MICACLVHKIYGYCYYKKGVYVQVIRSTARPHFRWRQHGPYENVYIRKTNLLKTLEIPKFNEENF